MSAGIRDEAVEQAIEMTKAIFFCDIENLNERCRWCSRILNEKLNRVLAAHRREVAELTANLDALEKAMERVCSRDEVNEIIAIKKEIQDEGK